MKRQHIVLLSIVLLACTPLYLEAKGGKNKYKQPTQEELDYTANQATENTSGFEQITKNDATPSVVTETQKKESQFAPGTYYNEINKPLYQRIFGKRDLRGLADKTIAPFESDKGCDKVLGTGEREENVTFFSEVLKSHIAHNELDKAKRVSDFASFHQIPLSKDALVSATKFFEEHSTALQQEHESLAPQVAKDKDVRSKQVAITAALERLKVNNPVTKK
jgi:hypothetical protein